MNRAYSLLNVKTIVETADEWVIEGVASTPTADRMDDVVEPMGAVFKPPMPLLWQHMTDKPVGRVEFAKPGSKGIPYVAHLPKVREAGALKDRIDEAVQSIKYRLVMAVSIGFRALKDGVEVMKNGGYRFTAWEWLELSLVTIPANAEATITSIKSIDDRFMRAALGSSRPGVSGTPPRQKGTEMKTLKELLELYETKKARADEISTAWQSKDYARTDEERAELRQLEDDIEQLEDDILMARMHERKSASARPIDGSSQENGSRSRGGLGFVKTQDPDDKFKGQSLTRLAMAKAAAFIAMKEGNFLNAGDWAERRWGKSHPNLVRYIKAAVAGGGTGSGEWGAELAQSDTRYNGDFVEFLYSLTVFDRLPLRSVPARVHIKGQDGAATGYWVGESKAIPVSKPDFSDVELTPLKVGAISVCSKELVTDSDPSAELWIRDSIAQASAQRVDTTFLSAAAASAGVSPAGILNGVSALAPSGTDAAAVRADMMSLYAGFLTAKNASGLVQVMTPSMAKALALLVNALGQPEFVGLNADGGKLLGDAVITGDNVTPGDWILLKPSDIWKIGDSGVQISMSDSAMVEQDTAPTGATDTPTAASATIVSLWQEESIGFKVVRRINFQKRRTSAVAVLSNAEYGGVVS